MRSADEEPKHCRWAGSDSPRLLRTHLRDCETPGCEVCQPCGERHCRVCGREHVTLDGRGTDQTCTDCLHDVRTDLADIVARTHDLLAEAMSRGISSEAAALIAPAAEPEDFRRRIAYIRFGNGCRDDRCPMHADLPRPIGPACSPLDDKCEHRTCRIIDRKWCSTIAAMLAGARIGQHHPLYVLAEWERVVRHELGHDRAVVRRATIEAAADYLDGQLTDLAHDADFGFEDLALALRQTRGHLEDVLHDNAQPDKGAPCPSCGKANLEHIYGDDEDEDHWACPRKMCGQWWTEEEYRKRVEGTYVQVADALTASQIATAYRVPEGTVRSWVARKRVRKRGRDAQGRQLYDVADTLAQRDSEALSDNVG
jgi:hypothetical protein